MESDRHRLRAFFGMGRAAVVFGVTNAILGAESHAGADAMGLAFCLWQVSVPRGSAAGD